MKLLIAEDGSDIVLVLCRTLANDYSVDTTSSLEGTLRKLKMDKYDALILDLNMSNETGLKICEKVRSQGRHTPILVLSCCTNVLEKVKLLDSGANDYLTKPFEIDELKARLRVLLRQPAASADGRHRLVVEDLVLDSVKYQVERAGKDIRLRKKEFAVLECLMKNAGRVVSRDILLNYAWDEFGDSATNTIDVHIKYLRDKIDKPYEEKLIKTIHGIGYKVGLSST